MNGERVMLPRTAWGMLWAIFISVITAVFGGGWFISNLSARCDSNAQAIIQINTRFHEHEILKGHAGVTERLDAEDKLIDRLQRQMDKVSP